eukprot:240340_1
MPELPWWHHVEFYEDPTAAKGFYAVWNHARYTFVNQLQTGEERWKCTVRGCTNCIYLKNGQFLYYSMHVCHFHDEKELTEPPSKKRKIHQVATTAVYVQHSTTARKRMQLHNDLLTHERWDKARVYVQHYIQQQ